MKKEKKEKKRKVPFKRSVANNFYALRLIFDVSKIYLGAFILVSVTNGILWFLTDTYLLRRIVDGVSAGEDIESTFSYVIVLGIICIVLYLCVDWFYHVINPPIHRKIGAYVDKKIFKKSAEVELSCYENPEFYDRYVKAMDGAFDRIMQVTYTLRNLISRIITLFANSALLIIIDPWLILFGLFPLALGFLRRLRSVAVHDRETAKKPIERRINYVHRTFYLNEYAKEMRIGEMHKGMLRDLRNTFTEFKAVTKKYGFRVALYVFIQDVGLEIVTIFGATLYAVWSAMYVGVANGGMSVGDCIVVLNSISSISYSLNSFVQIFAEFGEHALFIEDMRYFIDYETKLTSGEDVPPKTGEDVVLKNVSFKYDGSEKYALKNIDFTWRKGERIALVGSNGSGKTTLTKILLRFYDPTEGEVLMGGKNIKEYNVSSYRDRFSTVFQDFKMFSLTVRDNILLRPKKEGDDELVNRALEESGISDKIASFENGLDTILTREFDDRGENLSIGEQQKLSLARVFADSEPYVLLDEPSSALDPIAEYKMFENMMRATEGRSVIFISHRLSSAVLADRVVLMENGEIAEVGTHRELMARDGKYAAMFHRQAENYLGSEVGAHE